MNAAAADELLRDDSRRRPQVSVVLSWLLTAVAIFALAWMSKAYTRDATQLSTIWVVNGLLLGVMLSAPRAQWIAFLIAGLAGNIAAGIAVGDSLFLLLDIAVWNVAEVAMAAYVLCRYVADPTDLGRPRSFAWFILFPVVLAPALSGLLLMASGMLVGYPPAFITLRTWFIAHALGAATTAPVVLALRKGSLWQLLRRASLPGTLASLALLVGITVLVFWQARYPLLFLVFPPLLLIAMRTDLSGMALSLLVVALIGAWFTTHDMGPLSLAARANQFERLLLLQVFIAVLLMSLMPVVVALSERRREQDQAKVMHARYQLLANHVSDVVILTHQHRRVYVSPAVNEVLGWTPEEFVQLTYGDLVHPDDWERVRDAVAAREGDARDTIVYRARRKDGHEIWLEAQISRFHRDEVLDFGMQTGETLPRKPGKMEGSVVTLRDITRRLTAEQAAESANRELASLVWKDGLTGLANRRRFDTSLRSEWARAHRDGTALSIVILDVDHFKIYNDRYGHQLGDRCLIAVSDAIASSLFRPSDLAARYGGEEFAVVLPGANLASATKVARRIQENVVAHGMEHAGSSFGIVTVSVGVASAMPHPGATPDDLLKAADEALYASKHAGRNRVTNTELL